MILVNVNATWRRVLTGRITAAESTLGRWYQVPDASIEEYGDAIAGVYRGRIVSVFGIEDFTREDDERVTFIGKPSARWSHLIGTLAPNPWQPGQGRPVKYLDTYDLPVLGESAA